MKRVIVLLVACFACVSYKRVSIEPGNPDGDGCLQICKQTKHNDDAIVECASTCPGALVQNDDCDSPSGVDGEPEAAPLCVATAHVRWGRIAKTVAVIGGAALVVTALLFVAFLSAPTH